MMWNTDWAESVSTLGKYKPRPEGDISISAKSTGVAFSKPWTVLGENDSSKPDDKLMVMRSLILS